MGLGRSRMLFAGYSSLGPFSTKSRDHKERVVRSTWILELRDSRSKGLSVPRMIVSGTKLAAGSEAWLNRLPYRDGPIEGTFRPVNPCSRVSMIKRRTYCIKLGEFPQTYKTGKTGGMVKYVHQTSYTFEPIVCDQFHTLILK